MTSKRRSEGIGATRTAGTGSGTSCSDRGAEGWDERTRNEPVLVPTPIGGWVGFDSTLEGFFESGGNGCGSKPSTAPTAGGTSSSASTAPTPRTKNARPRMLAYFGDRLADALQASPDPAHGLTTAESRRCGDCSAPASPSPTAPTARRASGERPWTRRGRVYDQAGMEAAPALDCGYWFSQHRRPSEYATADEIAEAVAWIKATRSRLLRAIKLLERDVFPGCKSDGGDHPAVEALAGRRRARLGEGSGQGCRRPSHRRGVGAELRRRDQIPTGRRHLEGRAMTNRTTTTVVRYSRPPFDRHNPDHPRRNSERVHPDRSQQGVPRHDRPALDCHRPDRYVEGDMTWAEPVMAYVERLSRHDCGPERQAAARLQLH